VLLSGRTPDVAAVLAPVACEQEGVARKPCVRSRCCSTVVIVGYRTAACQVIHGIPGWEIGDAACHISKEPQNLLALMLTVGCWCCGVTDTQRRHLSGNSGQSPG
jgi:hypothetical protein